MARPTRKQIKFDEKSVNELLQEIYNDSHNIRAKIARLFTKWESKVKEDGHIAAIGDQIVKLIQAEAKNQDQKIMLLRYLKEVVFEKEKNNGKKTDKDGESESEITPQRRQDLIKMVEAELKNK